MLAFHASPPSGFSSSATTVPSFDTSDQHCGRRCFGHRALLLIASCALLLASPAGAQVYSWRDASGKIHYSDTPPPGGSQARRVTGAPLHDGSGSDAARKAQLEKELDQRKEKLDAQEGGAKSEKDKEKESAEAEERRRQCQKAQGQLEALESGVIRFTVDDKGDRVALDGAAREKALSDARKTVESWCK